MIHILFVIWLTVEGANIAVFGAYPTMSECFEKHDALVEEIGRPIINYRPVCVATTFLKVTGNGQ